MAVMRSGQGSNLRSRVSKTLALPTWPPDQEILYHKINLC
jgi:hypothetical protein